MDQAAASYYVGEMNRLHSIIYPKPLPPYLREKLIAQLHYYAELLYQHGYEVDITADDHYTLAHTGELSPATETMPTTPRATGTLPAPSIARLPARHADTTEMLTTLRRIAHHVELASETQQGYGLVETWLLSLPHDQRIIALWRLIKKVEENSRRG